MKPKKTYVSSEKDKSEDDFSCEISENRVLSTEDLDSGYFCYNTADSYKPPDPGFPRTADLASDDYKTLDWDAPVFEKPFRNCLFIEIKSQEVQPPMKRSRKMSQSLSRKKTCKFVSLCCVFFNASSPWSCGRVTFIQTKLRKSRTDQKIYRIHIKIKLIIWFLLI